MNTPIDLSTVGCNNKEVEEPFFTAAYMTFLTYLQAQQITCFDYMKQDDETSKSAIVTPIYDNRCNFTNVYYNLYQQKEKDIIQLFSNILDIDVTDLNYITSCEAFATSLYDNNNELGKIRRNDVEVIFEFNYIKITCLETALKLIIDSEKIEISTLRNVKLKIYKETDDIKECFKQFIDTRMYSVRKDLRYELGIENMTSSFICERFNSSLIDVYAQKEFYGFKLKCLHKFVDDYGFKNKVTHNNSNVQIYQTTSFNEFITITNEFFDKEFAQKLNQLFNLFQYMNNIEKKELSFKIMIRSNSKYNKTMIDPLKLVVKYKEKELKINFNTCGDFFESQDYYTNNEDVYSDSERLVDNDLNKVYLKTLQHFKERIRHHVGNEDEAITANTIKLYEMMLF